MPCGWLTVGGVRSSLDAHNQIPRRDVPLKESVLYLSGWGAPVADWFNWSCLGAALRVLFSGRPWQVQIVVVN
jgi:hypothetical protein